VAGALIAHAAGRDLPQFAVGGRDYFGCGVFISRAEPAQELRQISGLVGQEFSNVGDYISGFA